MSEMKCVNQPLRVTVLPLLTGNVSNPGHVLFGAFAVVRRLPLKYKINENQHKLVAWRSS
jgi:hypothetical protein